jgi:hypothetical protein
LEPTAGSDFLFARPGNLRLAPIHAPLPPAYLHKRRNCAFSTLSHTPLMLKVLLLLSLFTSVLSSDNMEVRVDVTKTNARGLPCTTQHKYGAMVTLSIENADGSLTPSGWSTRKEAGGDGKPFEFTPGRGLIEGWTEGVLKMREGERALIHVPASKGYGASPQGSKGGGWYIPGGSNLLFDLESEF